MRVVVDVQLPVGIRVMNRDPRLGDLCVGQDDVTADVADLVEDPPAPPWHPSPRKTTAGPTWEHMPSRRTVPPAGMAGSESRSPCRIVRSAAYALAQNDAMVLVTVDPMAHSAAIVVANTSRRVREEPETALAAHDTDQRDRHAERARDGGSISTPVGVNMRL